MLASPTPHSHACVIPLIYFSALQRRAIFVVSTFTRVTRANPLTAPTRALGSLFVKFTNPRLAIGAKTHDP
jgi:hypothetical protein